MEDKNPSPSNVKIYDSIESEEQMQRVVEEKSRSRNKYAAQDIQMQGYLRKRYRSSYYMGSDRYCVLLGQYLRWYNTEADAGINKYCRGQIIVKAVEAWSGYGSVHLYPHAFAIRAMNDRICLCSAASSKEKRRWIKALEQVTSTQYVKMWSPSTGYPSSFNSAECTNFAEGSQTAIDGRRIVPEDMIRYQQRRTAGQGAALDANAFTRNNLSCEETGCHYCEARFRRLVIRRLVCSSCNRSFCRRHCSEYVHFHHLDKDTTFSRRCCVSCAARQKLLGHLDAVTHILEKKIQSDSKMQERSSISIPNLWCEPYEITEKKLRTLPMSLIRTIKLMYQTRGHPVLFKIACERLPFYVENSIDRVENMWYQIVHLLQCFGMDAGAYFQQTFYLKRCIRAVCRRSPRIALQTMWQVQAALHDSIHLNSCALLEMLGFVFPPCSKDSADKPGSSLFFWRKLLLADSPEHQRERLLSRTTIICQQCDLLIEMESNSHWMERWLNANAPEDFERSAVEIRNLGITLCEHQSSISYDSLGVKGYRETLSRSPMSMAFEAQIFRQVEFVQSMACVSEKMRHIKPRSRRPQALKEELNRLNDNIDSILFPLCTASGDMYKIVRIPPEEGTVFNTRERAPTLILVELVPIQEMEYGEDIPDVRELLPFLSASRQSRTILDFEMDDKTYQMDVEPSLLVEESDEDSSRITGASSHCKSEEPLSARTSRAHCNATTCSQHTDMWDEGRSSDDGGVHSEETSWTPSATFPKNIGNACLAKADRFSTPDAQCPHAEQGTICSRSCQDTGENYVHSSRIYGETWVEKQERIRKSSPMGRLPGWSLSNIIVKTNDDLRQEMFTMQLIQKFQSIFEREELPLWLRSYRIIATGANIGLLETITDACSIDHLKKSYHDGQKSLSEYFKSVYPRSNSRVASKPKETSIEQARHNFITSMAAYSLVSYILLLKDRHNGNILLSTEGHIIHIDFGFILGIAPGGKFSLEDAPFKLTNEMVEVMGGLESDGYQKYRSYLCDGFRVLHKYQREILALFQTTGLRSPFPCFSSARGKAKRRLQRILSGVRDRLSYVDSQSHLERKVDELLRRSYNAWGTRQYDAYQHRSNNIYP